jgi:ABC-type branched-subunit amino acid transport system substrate-binding protein
MVLAQLQAPGFAFPESETVVKAAAADLNKQGGINGRPIEIEACNDQGDQNAAAACARQAVSDKVVAVLGLFTLYGDAVLPVLESAKIPYVGNTILSASDSSSPMAFPMDGGVVGGGASVGQQLAKNGSKKVGAIGYDNAASTLYMSWVQKGAEANGASWVGDVRVPQGNPDYGPAVASITGKGADSVFISLPAAEAAKLLGAIAQSGTTLKIGTGITTVPAQVVAAVPAAATNGAVLTSSTPSSTDTTFPGVQDYLNAMKANGVSDKDANAPYGLLSYARAQVLFNAMKKITGDVTTDSVYKAMSSITDPGTPLLGKFSTTKEFATKGFNRLFNFTYIQYTAQGQKMSLATPQFFDVTPIVSAS